MVRRRIYVLNAVKVFVVHQLFQEWIILQIFVLIVGSEKL